MQAVRCEKCGNSFDTDSGCQVCLLQLGLSKANANVAVGNLPSITELNSSFPQLEITRLIGRGGMGAIYQARQMSLDRDVALKLIAKEVSQDPTFVERFEREAKTLAKLSHPNIVTVYDFGYTSSGVAYLIMEFVDGINLREAMSSRSVGPEDALDIVATTCRALEYAHSRGVIHRDIKPENILLGEDGSLKVVDFGIAKIVDDSVRTPTLTATRQVLGSLHYLAPEQLESPDQVDHRVDLYALGVVFYELLTGELPLGRYEPPSVMHSRIDKRVDSVVLKSLSRKPINRFQTAREFGTEVQQLKAAQPNLHSQIAQVPPPLPNTQADPLQPVSVPFNCDFPFTYDTMGGFAEALGMVYANEHALCIEFRTRDKLMGVFKSRLHLIEIPFGKITRCELIRGVFSAKLVVSANSLSVLSELPNSEAGFVELHVKRSNVAAAKRLLKAIGFGKDEGEVQRTEPIFGTEAHTQQSIFGGLMILSGIANLGGLAIGQVINANAAHTSTASLAIGAIVLSVLIGPVALIQLVGGVLNFVLPMKSLNGVLTVMSLLPIAPAWLLSVPAAIWASPWMRGESTASSQKPAWGATTLMFIRESRWSKVVAAANAIGLSLVALLGVGYLGGFYRTALSYRVVSSGSIETAELTKRVQSRVSELTPSAQLNYDEDTSRYTIYDWKYNADKIKSSLAIEGQVQLVWLAAADSQMNDDFVSLPLAGILAIDSLARGTKGLSTTVVTGRPPIDLTPEMISGVDAGKSRKRSLSIELSTVGRERLATLRDASPSGALGLVIGGLVEGVATTDAISNKRIAFELCEQSEFSPTSIEAAIHGPALPCELELIQ
ncbi:MAG: serine/threonine-protein kinase [Pirellulaceae bacterium]|nr:serine/threonine-protein kinase [Pirellulaceae bacterium]